MKASKVDLDRLGTWASTLCAIHCVANALIFGLLSVVGLGFFGSPVVEIAFLGSAVLVGFFAAVRGYGRHRSLIPACLFAMGIACWVVAHYGEWTTGRIVHAHGVLSTSLAVAGGGCLVAFHWLNQRSTKIADSKPKIGSPRPTASA